MKDGGLAAQNASGTVTLIAGNGGLTERLQTLVSVDMHSALEKAVQEGKMSSVRAFVCQALDKELALKKRVYVVSEGIVIMDDAHAPAGATPLNGPGGLIERVERLEAQIGPR